jgi:hypothetical protein
VERDDDAIVIPSAINVVIGIWLVLSPLVLDYEMDDPQIRPIAGGALIATLACLRAARTTRTAALSWANAALGVWLFALPVYAQTTPIVAVNFAICGGLVAILAVMSALNARY